MIKLRIITTKHKASDTRVVEKQLKSLKSIFDIDFHHSDITKKRQYKYRKKNYFKLIQDLFDKDYQILLVHDLDLIILSSILSPFLKRQNKKIIADIHEDYPLQLNYKNYLPKPLRIILSQIMKLIFPYMLTQLDGIIYATDEIYNKYFKRVNTKQCYIRNYPKTDLLHPNTTKHYDIGYVGSITELRGAKRILEIIKLGYKVLLIGPLNDEFSRKNFSADKILKMPNLTYLGELEYRLAMNEIAKVKIGLLPLIETQTYSVSLPVKLFEYLSLELFVLSSNFSYWQEKFGHVPNIYFVDFENTQEVNKTIQSILRINQLIEFKNEFSWETEEEKLLKFMTTIC